MKPKEFTLEVLKNIGNYENVKLSVTATCEKGEEPDFAALKEMIERQYYNLYVRPKEQPKVEDKRKVLNVGDDDYKQIHKRLYEKTCTMEQIEKYYIVSDQIRIIWKNQGLI